MRPARLPADAKRYNDIALKIMDKHDIQVNDLHAVVERRLEELQKPQNVHFNRRGNEVLIDHVTTVIQAALVAMRSKK